MNNKRLILLVGLFLSIGSTYVKGQNYQPFYPNQTYNFRCQYDLINEPDLLGRYGLRIKSSIQVGTITVHRFNRIGAGKNNQSGPIYINQDNIFGKEMIQKPGGLFEFITSNQDTISLHTQLPLQTTWVFHQPSGITAQITSKTLYTLFGSVTDSVLNISLSNGKEIVLSKKYGFVEVEPFFPRHFSWHKIVGKLYLAGIDELGVGETYPSFNEMYDYYPGEKFYYLTTINGWDYCTKIYNRRTILSREDPNASGGITYTVEEAKIRLDYYPGPPSGYVWDTINLGRDTITETFFNRSFFSTHNLSNEVRGSQYLAGPFEIPGFGNRKRYQIHTFQYVDSLGELTNYSMADVKEFGEGLGLFSHFYTGNTSGSSVEIELECYQKLTDSLDDCFSLEAIVSTEQNVPEFKVKTYPNPTADHLWIEWTPQTEPLEITLFDATGKLIHSWTSMEPRIEVNTRSFANGIYILKMGHGGEIARKEKIMIIR